MNKIIALSLLLLWAAWGVADGTPNASDLVKKADIKLRGEKSSTHYVDFTVKRPGQTLERKMVVRLKEKKYSFSHFTQPASDRDTTILKRDHDMWMYTPKVKKTIRIPVGMMHQGVLGSDFTYDDILKEATLADDYSHHMVSESSAYPKEKYGRVFVIDLYPLPGRPVTYAKLRTWVSEKYVLLRTQYYAEKKDKDGKKTFVVTRILHYSNIANMGGRDIPTQWRMENRENAGYETVYELKKATYNTIEDNNMFAPRSLENPPRVEWGR